VLALGLSAGVAFAGLARALRGLASGLAALARTIAFAFAFAGPLALALALALALVAFVARGGVTLLALGLIAFAGLPLIALGLIAGLPITLFTRFIFRLILGRIILRLLQLTEHPFCDHEGIV
jgi:hypothetical protein